jgi:xylulokinase
MPVLAIDAGVTACKAGVFDGGRLLGYACRHYAFDCPVEGRAEQDPNLVWSTVEKVVDEALRFARVHKAITAISLSVQGDAVIPIDGHGEPLAPAMLGIDNRSIPEAGEIEERFGSGPLYAATGMPASPLNAITKVFWLQRNRPDIARDVWKYVHYAEFLGLKLAGIAALDFTMASRTMAFDPVRKDWLQPVLEFVGIGPGHLGNVTPSGVPVGIIRAAVADEWGIPRTTLLVSGGHNQSMASIGAGAIEPGRACYSMGAAEVIGTPLSAPNTSPAMLASSFPCYCHAIPDRYLTITLNQSGGGLALEWLGASIFGMQAGDENTIARLVQELAVSPSPVLFLPHLAGRGTPAIDPCSQGAFVGLSFKSARTEMLQAVIDAQAFEARVNLEALERLEIHVSDIRAVDSGARLSRALEIKAAVLDRPIHTLRTPEAALAGCAMLAQVAIGDFADIESACRECVRIADTVEPPARARVAYQEAFERYRPLYATLRPFYRHWSSEKRAFVPV